MSYRIIVIIHSLARKNTLNTSSLELIKERHAQMLPVESYYIVPDFTPMMLRLWRRGREVRKLNECIKSQSPVSKDRTEMKFGI
jgi:hypothetical protein